MHFLEGFRKVAEFPANHQDGSQWQSTAEQTQSPPGPGGASPGGYYPYQPHVMTADAKPTKKKPSKWNTVFGKLAFPDTASASKSDTADTLATQLKYESTTPNADSNEFRETLRPAKILTKLLNRRK